MAVSSGLGSDTTGRMPRPWHDNLLATSYLLRVAYGSLPRRAWGVSAMLLDHREVGKESNAVAPR
jgi:hypothetical protein